MLEKIRVSALVRAPEIGLAVTKVPLVLAKIGLADECWLWTASIKQNGYGQYNDGARNWNAHRLVFMLAGGVIPDGMELDHLCRNRRCVRPDHLEPVTRAVNVRRQSDLITHCPLGHEYDEENTYLWRGMRHCRTCRLRRAEEQKARRRAE